MKKYELTNLKIIYFYIKVKLHILSNSSDQIHRLHQKKWFKEGKSWNVFLWSSIDQLIENDLFTLRDREYLNLYASGLFAAAGDGRPPQ